MNKYTLHTPQLLIIYTDEESNGSLETRVNAQTLCCLQYQYIKLHGLWESLHQTGTTDAHGTLFDPFTTHLNSTQLSLQLRQNMTFSW